jgi:SAM-dependent methyltransferase
VKGATTVHYCDNCTHIQTTEVDNIDNYYDKYYKLLVESDEEDQIYYIRDREKVFRYDHQVDTLIDLIEIPTNANILDYGCAKATTLKKLVERRSDITPYLFDVSDMYVPFWKTFVDEQNWAIYSVNNRWNGTMDVVTSFFSLEHVSAPKRMLANIWKLLKDDGLFYCIVPDVMQNLADFIVRDHVNHFTRSSIFRLLVDSGFDVQDINTEDHASAMIVIARKSAEEDPMGEVSVSDDQRSAISAKVSEMAEYWASLANRIQTFESTLPESAQMAIYGSGFYGTYIAGCLANQERIKIFLDRDPYRQSKKLYGKAIIDPELMPELINTVFVGLNPAIARQNIEKITSWQARKIQFFYL